MMLPNTAPALGADSVRPSKPWQIYILRGQKWVPVGACANRALAETQIATLRQFMRGHQFTLAWEGQANG